MNIARAANRLAAVATAAQESQPPSPDGGQETVEHRSSGQPLGSDSNGAQGTATTDWDASHFL